MAFVNSTFPNLKLIHGLQREMILPTTVVTNGSAEYRINRLQNYRLRWTWPSRMMKAEDRKALALFFSDTALGSLNSFKFKDPDVNTWSSTPLVYSGSSNRFFLRTGIDNHPVFHLDADVVVRSGATPVSFTKTVVNGIPYVTVPGYTSGLTISGTFYFAARFDQTNLGWASMALNSSNQSIGDQMDDVVLTEVFEY